MRNSCACGVKRTTGVPHPHQAGRQNGPGHHDGRMVRLREGRRHVGMIGRLDLQVAETDGLPMGELAGQQFAVFRFYFGGR